MTTVIMGIILTLLIALTVVGIKYCPDGNNGFLSLDETTAMRGVFVIIIIMVHVPDMFGNRIQDAIGSFAYIGVTFFFLTSSFGITLKTIKEGRIAKYFWRKRIVKLICVQLCVNIVFVIGRAICFKTAPDFSSLRLVNLWIWWILSCYAAIWVSFKLSKNIKVGIWICTAIISVLSICIYFLKFKGLITSTTWCCEVIGFIWGMFLALYKDKIYEEAKKDFKRFATILFVLSICLGLSYLKMKDITFAGDYLLKIMLGVSILGLIVVLNSIFSFGNKASRAIGKMSFEIYIIQVYVAMILPILLINSGSGKFIAIYVVASLAIGCIAHLMAEGLVKLIFKIPFFSKKEK